MTIPPSTLATQERRFQAVVVGGLVTVFAIVALSPHTERALFEEGRLPSAFAAIATDPVTPLLSRFGVMEPATFARAFRTGRPVGPAPVRQVRLPGLIPPVAVDQPPAFFAQPDDATPGLVADAGVLDSPGRPGFQVASFTPGAGTGVIGIGAGPTPGGGPDPQPTPAPTPTVPPIVSPIPEPTSWMMLLVGMLLVGIITRRAQRRSTAVA